MATENATDIGEDDMITEETEGVPGKRTGSRYWDSYEEISLVELWKKYSKLLTQFTENTPVFRRIAIDMHNRGVNVNRQECRRKLGSLNNKYKRELNKIKKTRKRSEWRLFPLIYNIYEKKNEPYENENEFSHRYDELDETMTVRTSQVMQYHFTMTGVEKLRKQNQTISWEYAEAKRHLMIKKRELKLIEQAHKYLDDYLNNLDRNSIRNNHLSINYMLLQIPIILTNI